jgi:signal peptidase II
MKKNIIILSGAVIFLVIIDLIIKSLAASWSQEIQILPFFSLVYRENIGAAWGIYINPILLIALNFAILILVNFFFFKNADFRSKLSIISLALISGGACGNIIDRLFLGYVRDYISVGWWPVFNLADAYIVIGIFLIIVFYGKIIRVKK